MGEKGEVAKVTSEARTPGSLPARVSVDLRAKTDEVGRGGEEKEGVLAGRRRGRRGKIGGKWWG
jgi:hypothetical protein